MLRNFSSGAIIALLLAASSVLASADVHAQGRTMRFATGPSGTAWGALGNALVSVWERALPFSDVETQPGDVRANIDAIENGTAELALSTSSATADAIAGKGSFSKKYTNVCQLGALYPQALQVFAAAETKAETIGDLKGKVVAVPRKGDAAEPVAELVLKANGLGNGAVKTVPADSIEAMDLLKDGKVQAAILGGRVPIPEMADFATLKALTLLAIPDSKGEEIEQDNPGVFTASVKSGTYAQQDKPALSAAYAVQLLIGCNQGETRAYGLIKAISENLLLLLVTESAFDDMDESSLAEDFGAPIHTGAELFFTEAPKR